MRSRQLLSRNIAQIVGRRPVHKLARRERTLDCHHYLRHDGGIVRQCAGVGQSDGDECEYDNRVYRPRAVGNGNLHAVNRDEPD